MVDDRKPKKQKVTSAIEKLEDRIAPGGIAGLVGDLGADAIDGSNKDAMAPVSSEPHDSDNSPNENLMRSADEEHQSRAEEKDELPTSTSEIVNEQINHDGSVVISFADGSVETHHSNGSGHVDYPDGERESWDGLRWWHIRRRSGKYRHLEC